MAASTNQDEESNDDRAAAERLATTDRGPSHFLERGGYAFFAISAVSFVFCIIRLYLEHRIEYSKDLTIYEVLALTYTAELIALLVGIFSASIGYLLLRAAGTANREVIPRQDSKLIYELLLRSNDNGLNNYIKLSSLSGFVGLCTKLGIGGLPLATIVLTMFFSVLGLINANAGFFDLAKLTLGAFIGSYVQRQRGDEPITGGRDPDPQRRHAPTVRRADEPASGSAPTGKPPDQPAG